MVICKFCGFENADDAIICSRCESPLKEGQQPVYSARQVSESEKKTMRLNRQMPSASAPAPSAVSSSELMVHECGYPLLPGTQVCPNCHKPVTVPAQAAASPSDDSKKTMRMPVGQSSAASSQMDKQTRRDFDVRYPGVPLSNEKLTVKDSIHVKNGDAQPPQVEKRTVMMSRGTAKSEDVVNKQTINPFAQSRKPQIQEEPVQETFYCSLKPTSRNNEPESELIKQEYEEGEVILNRQNTEPNNMSITSREQAVLTCENGQWFIEDRSSWQTTFIHASRKMPLQDGDVIMMGDREFVFSTKKEQ